MSTQVTYHAKGVALTTSGAEKVREFLGSQGLDEATAGLRVGVRGGGCSGVPFMKRITGLSPIAFAIASRIGLEAWSVMVSPS